MTYFTGCKTIEDVKATFRTLAKQLHPDCGGNADEFRAMMQEYTAAFNRLKNVHVNKDGEKYEKATTETPEQFAEIINKVIFMEGVKIEIIGSWVWLSGNTFNYKDQIKAAGFWYSKSKKAWYYNGDTEHTRRRGRYSMNGLRAKWGAQEIKTEEVEKLTA